MDIFACQLQFDRTSSRSMLRALYHMFMAQYRSLSQDKILADISVNTAAFENSEYQKVQGMFSVNLPHSREVMDARIMRRDKLVKDILDAESMCFVLAQLVE